MSPYTYGDIPDDFVTKGFVPLGEHIYKLFLELGHDYFTEVTSSSEISFFSEAAEIISEKFKIAVESAKKVISGEIQNPEKVLSTWFFPPVMYVRSDLQMGTTKLIYGNSTDITFICINDTTFQPELLINGHMEDGVPVDYWYILGEDEVFERRHMKLGMKLREIPEKTKDFVKGGFRMLDVLRDVRNERSPQWGDAAYSMCMLWISGAINMFVEPSSWNALAQIWDGVNAKKIYGRPDHFFCYVPWPPILNVLFAMGRPEWTMRLTGLTTSHRLFVNGFEPHMMNFYKEKVPEVWEWLIRNMMENGVPTPRMTLGCLPPDLKNKKKFKRHEFNWIYPEGPRVMPYEWNFTDDEVFGGIFTDITHETPSEPFYGEEHIISRGIGGI
ncbi:MAG: hypothetical protein ACFFDN_11455 [Candidatus Hodarchaeota archaeon]